MYLNKKIILAILDGWGYRQEAEHNAIHEAKTPFMDYAWETYPHSLLYASESHVGLPEDQIGNSEIGHMTIGTGHVIEVDLVRINQSIAKGDFYENQAFTRLFDHITKHNSSLHVMGLLSPGGIHSHRDHLYAFLKGAKSAGVTKIIIHAFTDGRDVPPTSAAEYLRQLEDVIEDDGISHIATVQGRFYAMDRDKNWERIQKAEKALIYGEGRLIDNRKPSEIIEELYKDGHIDEHLEPMVFLDDDGKGWPISENDGVFFFNFRADRARQISEVIEEHAKTKNILFVTMTRYSTQIESTVAFSPVSHRTTLAHELSVAGLTQVHIAETEKYAHVTYFFNGGTEYLEHGERHVLIDSRKDITTHDQAPEMRAKEIADVVINELHDGTDVIIVNFANADMVGHTANYQAILRAVEKVDTELKRIYDTAQEVGATMLITADHGNAEQNIDIHTGERHTAHTLSVVPFILTDKSVSLKDVGTLADIAPTVLELLDLDIPEEMDTKGMIEKA
jgi:2,3-bisphosphoglycerate-independent phosphoglycerate mutase